MAPSRNARKQKGRLAERKSDQVIGKATKPLSWRLTTDFSPLRGCSNPDVVPSQALKFL
jgi:hypothetical protein